MPYTDVFGGANIYPSEISYSSLTLVEDVFLSWPEETSASNNLATRIIDVNSSVFDAAIFLPEATKAGTGETILFNNLGSIEFVVKDSTGAQVIVLSPGSVWQVYLTDNTTAAGTWVTLQYGAAISSANASALAGTGIIAIGTMLSQSMPVTSFNVDYTAGTTDRAKTYIWVGSGSGVLTLPNPSDVGNNWFFYVKNSGGGQLTVTPTGSLIDGLSTKIYQNNESSVLVSDGTNFYSIGFGKSTAFTFDFTTIDVSGTGNYTLTGSQLNRIVYKFTGVLTGNRNVVVPETVQQYWVDNSTTGSFSLSVTTLAGTPQAVGQGERAIIYCDGLNVVDADTSAVTVPLDITEGGTNSTTAGGALINLGGTSIGISIFTDPDANAVWSDLGNQPFLSGGEF